ncbi:MAG: acetyl-coenzyme A synthetase N-terminal domain-containing protein, partial [Desulforhopalus sp.]|nr:acetyl-coenzyme A synthetase N-terminal domain-containing protein [Desulforhopalus sp.]
MGKYAAVFQQSIENPEEFWAEAAKGITWYSPWEKVLDASNPPFYRW